MGKKFRFKVRKEEADMRLGSFIASRMKENHISVRAIKKAMEHGAASLNSKRMISASKKVSCNDSVIFILPEVSTVKKIKLEIIYEDEYFLAINKPANLPSAPTDSNSLDATRILKEQRTDLKTVRLLHRLDKDTTGVLLFALSNSAYEHGIKLFADRAIKKTYSAVVSGTLSKKQGTWRSQLKRIENNSSAIKMQSVSNGGKEAITHYKVVNEFNSLSELEIILETGRTHQIRVHCSENGHPVLGDILYNCKAPPTLHNGKLSLHAKSLEFTHPITNKKISI